MEFRFSVFCSIAVFMFPLVAKILFWKAVYRGTSGSIAGFDMGHMVTYLLVHQFVFELTWCYPGQYQVRSDIIWGGLTRHLLMPVDYLRTVFFRWTGTMLPRVTSTIGIFALLCALFGLQLQFASEWWVLPAALFSIFVCYVLSFLISFLQGLAAFWTESGVPLVGQVRSLLCGAIVPLAFLPGWVQVAGDILPFKYTLYFPTVLILGKVTPAEYVKGTAISIAWIVILYVAIQLVWKRGIKRYEAYGG
jgi:ABC-2 type transport system permease protein